jgi:hypothetical protein
MASQRSPPGGAGKDRVSAVDLADGRAGLFQRENCAPEFTILLKDEAIHHMAQANLRRLAPVDAADLRSAQTV